MLCPDPGSRYGGYRAANDHQPVAGIAGRLGWGQPARRAYSAQEVWLRHWMLMFRAETHAAAARHGLIGVHCQHRRRFADVRPGDKFIAYLSRVRLLDGHGEVTSEPFQEVSDTPKGWQSYTERCRVRFDQKSAGIDATDLLWGLSAFATGLNTSPANMIFCKGGFLEITAEDYLWFRTVLDGTWIPPAEPFAPRA